MDENLIIHSDGGSRGNPGPGACAFVIEKKGQIIATGSKHLGRVTNNFAEYSGVLLAITHLVKNLISQSLNQKIEFYLDSELVAKQLSGLYKIKNKDLLKLNIEIKTIMTKNKLEVVFKNIPRQKNKLADYLVNKELDKVVSEKFL